MIEIIRREFVYLWYYFDIQLRQIFWYWVLGMVLGSAISVFAKEKIHNAVRSLTDKKLGVFGVVPASILGIASPLCMYGTIPLAASFSRYGISDDWLAAFMMSSILLNPQLIIYSAALGPVALIVRIAACFLCGIAAGLLIRFFYKGKAFFNFTSFSEPILSERKSVQSHFPLESINHDTDPKLSMRILEQIFVRFKAKESQELLRNSTVLAYFKIF